MKKYLPLSIIILSFLIAFYFRPLMPDLLASHWNIKGEVDGYMTRDWGLFLMPFMALFMYALFLFLPKTDPYRKNFLQFKPYFDNFVILILFFLFYIYLTTIVWNLGYRFNLIQVISPAFAALFYYASILVAHAKRNWFVGIRTPWTLSNQTVWDKTHVLAAKLYRVTALLTLFGFFFPEKAILLMLFPLLASTVIVFIYSYLEFQKVKK